MKSQLYFVALLSFFLTSCGPGKYVTSDYDRLVKSHRLIAILPYANHYTGRLPKDMTDEDLLELRVEDGLLFQRSLYYQILEETGRGNKDINISLQDISITNKLLKDNNIPVEETWSMDPREIAALLNVDAIVQVTMHKDHMLTDTESFLLEAASTILDLATNRINPYGRRVNKTSELYFVAKLIDGDRGVPLWAIDRECDTDWDDDVDEVVRNVNNHISKKFPYRKNM